MCNVRKTIAVTIGFAVLAACHATSYAQRDIVNADFEMRSSDGGVVAWTLPPETGWRMADGEESRGSDPIGGVRVVE